jgi:peptidoglycan hydrolase CwlO-like protein
MRKFPTRLIVLGALATAITSYQSVIAFDFLDQGGPRYTRNELLQKQDHLLREEDALKKDVANLYAELKDKNYELDQVESELQRTRNELQDVERNLH